MFYFNRVPAKLPVGSLAIKKIVKQHSLFDFFLGIEIWLSERLEGIEKGAYFIICRVIHFRYHGEVI